MAEHNESRAERATNALDAIAARVAEPETVGQANARLRAAARDAAWWLYYIAGMWENGETGFDPEVFRRTMRAKAAELDTAVANANTALDIAAFGRPVKS